MSVVVSIQKEIKRGRGTKGREKPGRNRGGEKVSYTKGNREERGKTTKARDDATVGDRGQK